MRVQSNPMFRAEDPVMSLVRDINERLVVQNEMVEASEDLAVYHQAFAGGELSNSTQSMVAEGVRQAMGRASTVNPMISMEGLSEGISLEAIDANLKAVVEGIKKGATALWEKVKQLFRWLGQKLINGLLILIKERVLSFEKNTFQIRRGALNDYFDPSKPLPNDWLDQLLEMVTRFDDWAVNYLTSYSRWVDVLISRLEQTINRPNETLVTDEVRRVVEAAKKEAAEFTRKPLLGRYTVTANKGEDEGTPDSEWGVYRAFSGWTPVITKPQYHEAPLKNAHAVEVKGDVLASSIEKLADKLKTSTADMDNIIQRLDRQFMRFHRLHPHDSTPEMTSTNRVVMRCAVELSNNITDVCQQLGKVSVNVIGNVHKLLSEAEIINE